MKNALREKVLARFEQSVNTPRDCEALSHSIYQRTQRRISSTTLRRFFGMLSSKTELSTYSLDTLGIFCGSASYNDFVGEYGILRDLTSPGFRETLEEVEQLTRFTLNSVSRKSLTPFPRTIPRRGVNDKLDSFHQSEYTVFPLIAPGGYGKSVALAHWVTDNTNGKSDNQILFCQASMMSSLLSQSKQASVKINLNLSDSNNFIQQFKNSRPGKEAKLILIIDGLDEPDNDSKGIIQLASFISNAAIHFSDDNFLKIILSVREVSWNKSLKPEFSSSDPHWMMFSGVESLESGSSNLPVLTNTEVRSIIDLFNAKRSDKKIIYECIDWQLRDLVRIPLNLHIFNSLTTRSVDVSKLAPHQLMMEYMNNIVFKTRFAEEKADIIWKMIAFSLNEAGAYSIRKSQLKNSYPIHLKKESNYFTAYQELLSLGILNEIHEENKYGLKISRVQFRHTDFFYFLSALYFIEDHSHINLALFKRIAGLSRGLEWSINVISYVFQLAYFHEDFEALRDFCELDEEILSSLPVRHTVGISFRQSNKIRIPLINRFAANPQGQQHFFERFVDTNYIFNNYEYRIQKYLEYKGNPEAKLFGHSILFLAGFLNLNAHSCNREMKEIRQIEPDNTVYPWPIGRKVSSTLYYHYIIEDDPLPDMEGFIDHYRTIAYSYKDYLERGMIEFEMSILVVLVLLEEFSLLEKIILHAHKNYAHNEKKHERFTWLHQHQNQLVNIFLDFARFKQNGKTDKETIKRCKSFLDNYISFFDDFQYLILISWFMYEYLLNEELSREAAIMLQNALDLASHAHYDFYTCFLVHKGEASDPDLRNNAAELIKNSRFNQMAPCFKSNS